MDAAGVDLAIISLTCPNVYWGGREVSLKAAQAAQIVNDDMAAAQTAYPSRIRWLYPVVVGTTVVATTIAEPGGIDQANPMRRIELGEPSGRVTPRVESIAAVLRDAGVEVRVTTDVRRAVWEKFIRPAPGAMLTSACQASIGEVRDTPEGAALYRALVAETVAVGRALGVEFPADAVESAMGQIQALPADMKTSMQLDYERRRRVELEELTGAVVRLGRRLGVPTPADDVLYAVLKVRATAFGGLG